MTSSTIQGFTLIELLLVIAIIGILMSVLLPTMLHAKAKANDTAAATVARQVATTATAVQVSSNAFPTCTYGNPNTVVVAGSESASVRSPVPVTNVSCVKNTATNNLDVTVTYSGGSQPDIIASVQQ